MNFVPHPSNNFIFFGNGGDIADLPVTVDNPRAVSNITSFWRPSPEELAALNAGHVVMLTQLANAMFPTLVQVTAEPCPQVEQRH